MGEDLLPESRTWSKEEIMGAKSSRDWLSNWSLGRDWLSNWSLGLIGK